MGAGLQRVCTGLTSDEVQQVQDKYKQIKVKLSNKEKELESLNSKVEELNSKTTTSRRLSQEFSAMKSKIEEAEQLSATIAEKNQYMLSLQSELDKERGEKIEKEEALLQKKKERDGLLGQVEEQKKANEEMTKLLEELEARLEQQQKELQEEQDHRSKLLIQAGQSTEEAERLRIAAVQKRLGQEKKLAGKVLGLFRKNKARKAKERMAALKRAEEERKLKEAEEREKKAAALAASSKNQNVQLDNFTEHKTVNVFLSNLNGGANGGRLVGIEVRVGSSSEVFTDVMLPRTEDDIFGRKCDLVVPKRVDTMEILLLQPAGDEFVAMGKIELQIDGLFTHAGESQHLIDDTHHFDSLDGHGPIASVRVRAAGSTVPSALLRWTKGFGTHGHGQIASVMQYGKLDVDAVVQKRGEGTAKTALHRCVQRGMHQAVKTLLLAKASVHIGVGDKNWTPLHYSAVYDCPEAAMLLIAFKSDVDHLDADKHTALHLASKVGATDTISALLQSDPTPDLELVDDEMMTPLLLACTSENLTAVTSLAEAGANLEVCNSKGLTPLLICTVKGHQDMAATLIEYGADVNAQDKLGMTALSVACVTRKTEFARMLIEHKADVTVGDNKGRLPIGFAAQLGLLDIVQLLVERGSPFGEDTMQNCTSEVRQYLQDVWQDRQRGEY